MRPDPRRHTALLGLLVACALALITGCSAGATPPPTAAGPDGAGSIAAAQQATAAPLPGYAVTVPALGVNGSVLVPLGLNPDHTIQVPPLAQPTELGLYDHGPKPGDRGPAVILGHINANGVDGAFAHLGGLKPGDRVQVARPDGSTVAFAVYKTATVPKTAFPTAAVYSDTPGPELRLLTCGGDLDRTAHNYLSNVIVWAKAA